jgi:general secretion pathway protein A
MVTAGAGILVSQERLGLAAIGAARHRVASLPVDFGSVSGPDAGTDGGLPATAPNVTDIPLALPGSTRLARILSDPSLRADRKSAFRSLYAQWGVRPDQSMATPECAPEQSKGLRCLARTGTWAKLRRIDLPAVIELASPAWERRYATVVGIDDHTATLELGGRRFTFPLGELDRYWEGSFIVLWKGPPLQSLMVGPGTRSKDVEWVRQRLSDLDGAPMAAKDRDVFDDDLRARVISFQRSRSLEPDGIVGEETLTHLSLTPRDPTIPRLSRERS